MEDTNTVELAGSLAYPEYKETANGYPRFTGKLVIKKSGTDRSGREYQSRDFIRIAAWGDLAQAMGELDKDARVNILGRITERSYTAGCKSCGADQKKYWYEVVVDNFTVA